MKFGPSHFPVGTVFRVGKHLASFLDDTKYYTVKALFFRGPRDYVIHTEETMFHLDHVARIIKRGPGETVVMKHTSRSLQEDVKLMSLDHDPNLPRKPGIHRTASPYAFIRTKIDNIVPSHVVIDYKKLMYDISNQPWVRTPKYNGSFHYWEIKRKQLDKFIRNNWIRYQKSLDAWEKEVREEQEEYNKASYEDIHNDLQNIQSDDIYRYIAEEADFPSQELIDRSKDVG